MLSVIIPTYNEEQDILNCLRSLENDGSKDNTLKILRKFRTKKYSFRVVRQDHKGAGEARNKGALRAKGNILVFVDADMTFSKNFLKNLTKPIADGKTRGTFSKDEFVSNWENIWARCWNINDGWEEGRRHKANYPNKQLVFRAIVKSEFEKVKGFTKGGYTDDWSLSNKLGYLADEAHGAVFFHKNPSSLSEVFSQAKWVGKRKYKLWLVGAILALLRVSLPLTLIAGVYKSVVYKEPGFVIFKFVYNTAISIGILNYLVSRNGRK
jgi:glycosyltransferase involved in cell wall biosynthesis